MKRGDKFVKIISAAGTETASIVEIAAVDKKRGICSTDTSHVSKASDIESDGVSTYSIDNGRAVINYIPGCNSRIIPLEE